MIKELEADTRFVKHYLPKARPDEPSSQDSLDWPQIRMAMNLVSSVTAGILHNGSARDMLDLMRGNGNQFAELTIKFGPKHTRTWHVKGNEIYKLEGLQRIIRENPWSVVGQAFGHIEPD